MMKLLRELWKLLTMDFSDLELEDDILGKHLVFDTNQYPLFIEPEDIQRAIKAELIDAAEDQDDRLVYQEGWQWPIDLWGLRNLIAIAHQEPNPDIALMSVVLSHGFQEYKPEEEE